MISDSSVAVNTQGVDRVACRQSEVNVSVGLWGDFVSVSLLKSDGAGYISVCIRRSYVCRRSIMGKLGAMIAFRRPDQTVVCVCVCVCVCVHVVPNPHRSSHLATCIPHFVSLSVETRSLAHSTLVSPWVEIWVNVLRVTCVRFLKKTRLAADVSWACAGSGQVGNNFFSM